MRIGLGIGIGSRSAGGGGGGGAIISAPLLTLSSPSLYPPPISVLFDETVLEGDTFQFQAAPSVGFGTPSIDVDVVLTAGIIAGSAITIPGLSAISSPAQTYFRARVRRGGSSSPWSTIVKHGDTTAPTITSAATASVAENTVNPTGTLTANEEIESWAIVGGADAALFSLAGNVWTLNATPDFESKPSYAVQFFATDYAGNTAVQNFTLNITDVEEFSPSIFSPTDKSAFVNLSGGNLSASSIIAQVGAPCRVRSNQARAGKRYAEFDITSISEPGMTYIGCANIGVTMTDFSNLLHPLGTWLRSNGAVYQSDGTTGTITSPIPALVHGLGDKISVAFDRTAGKIWFAVNGVWDGNPAAGTGGFPMPTSSNYYMIAGLVPQEIGVNSVTVNFGASSFTYPIPSGFEAFV